MKLNLLCRFTFISYLLFRVSILYGQTDKTNADSLFLAMHVPSANSSSVLYAHFDKNVYINNENAWFTAYLLNTGGNNKPTVLTLLLINKNNKSTVLRQQFAISDGLGFGNVFIPDTIPPGNYDFLLYTNVLINNRPVDTFVQPTTIMATSVSGISASLSILDSAESSAGSTRYVKIKVADKASLPLSNAELHFHVSGTSSAILPDKVKTDKNGEYTLSVPIEKIRNSSNILIAEINYRNESKTIRIALPVPTNRKYQVRFYPEGGNLVHATRSTVGWEVKDVYGQPLQVKAALFKDSQFIDSIATDVYGMGRFKFIPLTGSKYEVRLPGADSTYLMPKISMRGPIIEINKAIADDSLKLRLVSKFPGRYLLLVHNYKKAFFSLPVEVSAAGRQLVILLSNVPKGLCQITVLDSAKQPCAERLFFAHFDKRVQTKITTDKSAYNQRSKVNIKLQVADGEQASTKALVSIACIQSNRLDSRKSIDIESYFYLRHQLEGLPLKLDYMGSTADDQAYLENILLIKGWTKYIWQEHSEKLMQDTAKSIAVIPPFEGVVMQYGKPVKKVTSVLVMTDSAANVVYTDRTGHFLLDGRNIWGNNGRRIYLVLKNQGIDYSIKSLNNFKQVENSLINELNQADIEAPCYKATTDQQIVRGLEHAINLREVKITAKKENQVYEASHLYDGEKENECGDYVCRNNILNCPNHYKDIDNRAPVVGQTYIIGGGETTLYKGCLVAPKASALAIDGISYGKEFYAADYAQLNPSTPEYLSTIYWKHAVYVGKGGEITLSFYTSDITGPFKIVVQGVTNGNVLYGEKEFEVTKHRN